MNVQKTKATEFKIRFRMNKNKNKMEGYFVLTLFVSLVQGVFGDDVTAVSVMEGDSVTLHTGINKQQRDKMLWYYNDILIALVNGEPSKSCVYDGEGGIFSGRLDVDYGSGSLIITNIKPEHTGRYEANFIQSKSLGTSESLNRNSKCDSTKITRKTSNIGDTVKTFSVFVSTSLSVPDKINEELIELEKEVWDWGLSAGLIAGIAVVLLVFLSVSAAVIYCLYRRSTNAQVEKSKLEHLLKV